MSPVFGSMWEAGRHAKAKYGARWDDKVRLVEVGDGGWTWEKRRRW